MAERRVEAVERALTLLDAFNEEKREFSLAELSRVTGFYKSTILRLMASLEAFGYVVRDDKGTFRIGPAAARLAPLAGEGFRVERVIRPILRSLCELSGETASFYVRMGEERICRFRENGQHEIRHHLEEGKRLPLGVGAAGRILSGKADSHGVVVSIGEREPSVAAAAIGIFQPSGELLGAMALSGPRERFVASKERYQALLLEKGKELEAQLPQGPLVL